MNNKIVLFAEKWMELNLLSKIIQTQKDKYHFFSHIWKTEAWRREPKSKQVLLGKAKGREEGVVGEWLERTIGRVYNKT